MAEIAAPVQARFLTGSTMRHVITMTVTASLGLMAVFSVDLLNLFYIAWLNDTALTAAVGYSAAISFMMTSLGIGLMIAASALCARALGQGDHPRARRLASSSLLWTAVVSSAVTLAALPFVGPALTMLGAHGHTHEVAARFLYISLPSVPVMAVGFTFSGVLRAVGDARRSLYVTLSGAVATAILDPIFILWLDLGIDGAAIVMVVARLCLVLVGWWASVRIHDLVARPSWANSLADARPILAIAGPAILANLATPVAAGYMTAVIAPFGDAAVAANAVIGRLIPVCFGAVFALSGAVGPIVGQNYGAGRIDRVRRTMRDSFILVVVYVTLVWLLLALGRGLVLRLFGLEQPAEVALVEFFCLYVAGSWIFHGLLFVANASFNNLGQPLAATVLNWGKATLGTIPFATVGAQMGGAEGALAGQGVGAIVFGLAGAWWAYRGLGRLRTIQGQTARREGAA